MVDMVARIIADDNKRTLSFKSDEVVFGGGRLTTSVNEIDLDYDTFLEVYEEANKSAVANLKTQEKPKEEVKEETPKRTTRKRTRNEEMSTDEMIDNIPFAPDEEVEEKMNEITMANGTPTTIEDALAMPTEKEVKEQLEEEKAVEESKDEKKEEAPKATRTRKRRGE